MNTNQYQSLLGKSIKEVTIDGVKSKKIDGKFNHYSMSFIDPVRWYDGEIYFIFLTTDEADNIIRINFSLTSVIDKPFFDELINQYGKPDNILVIDEVLYQGEKILNPQSSFNQKVQERSLKTKEGTFEDNPLAILWKKPKFQISVIPKVDYNKTEITFSKIN